MARGANDPDLIKITELLLVPSSFLVAALGTADSNPHRAAVSLLGLFVSLLWWLGVHDAYHDAADAPTDPTPRRHPVRTQILYYLPVVFSVGWLASLIAHCLLWRSPIGTP